MQQTSHEETQTAIKFGTNAYPTDEEESVKDDFNMQETQIIDKLDLKSILLEPPASKAEPALPPEQVCEPVMSVKVENQRV